MYELWTLNTFKLAVKVKYKEHAKTIFLKSNLILTFQMSFLYQNDVFHIHKLASVEVSLLI